MSIFSKVCALLLTVSIVCGPPLEPVQDRQCRDRTWAKLHPQICYPGPFGIGGTGGGGGGGSVVGRILHDLTGGLL